MEKTVAMHRADSLPLLLLLLAFCAAKTTAEDATCSLANVCVGGRRPGTICNLDSECEQASCARCSIEGVCEGGPCHGQLCEIDTICLEKCHPVKAMESTSSSSSDSSSSGFLAFFFGIVFALLVCCCLFGLLLVTSLNRTDS